MPEKVNKFPGSWAASLDWDELADGSVYHFSAKELEDAGTKMETVRVYAHTYAKDRGDIRFKTKAENGGLFIQAVDPKPKADKPKGDEA